MADEEQKKTQKRDEDPVGKVYDSRLMRRLAHYLRPIVSGLRLRPLHQPQIHLRRYRTLPGQSGH